MKVHIKFTLQVENLDKLSQEAKEFVMQEIGELVYYNGTLKGEFDIEDEEE